MFATQRSTLGLFLAALLLTFWSGYAEATEYPVPASCTGDNVRLREAPSRDAKIVGKVNDGDRLFALSEAVVKGEVWYEVDHPTKAGAVWIFGKYLDTRSLAPNEPTPWDRLVWEVLMTFGENTAKARALFGKPQKETKEMAYIEQAREEWPEIILVYPGHTAEYLKDSLTKLTVKKGTRPFGSLRIGDPASAVTDLLGEPLEKSDNEWIYEVLPTELTFTIKNDTIAAMGYRSVSD